jgi:hypothetical protein
MHTGALAVFKEQRDRFKNITLIRLGAWLKEVEHKCKALSSNPSTANKERNKQIK